jgi:DNA replication protein DnaC
MMTIDHPAPVRIVGLPNENVMDQWRHYFFENIGARYAECSWESYVATTPEQRVALEQCIDYFDHFPMHARQGAGLILIGPPGTGKDHLLIATAKRIMDRYLKCKIRYRDGMSVVSELRSHKYDEDETSRIAELYAAPSLLCLSDPVPPSGELDDFDKRCMYRVIDRRYRESLPTCATLNVASRKELDLKIGTQVADRLCDRAVVVKCNWESFRKTK